MVAPFGPHHCLHVRGIGEAFPHQVARRVEHPRDDELLGLPCVSASGAHVLVGLAAFVQAVRCRLSCSTTTIQPTPNLSASMPKRGEKNVWISGWCTGRRRTAP